MPAAADISATRRRLARAWLGLAAIGAVAFLAVDALVVQGLVYYGIGGGSLVLGALALRRGGGIPRPWLLILAAAATWLAGDLVWAGLEQAGHDLPFPAPTDAISLAGYPLMFAGVLSVWRARTLQPLGGLLDTAIVAIAGGIFVWATTVSTGGADDGAWATAVALAYPTFDIALLAATAQILAAGGLGRLRSLQALTAALTLSLAAHVAYATQALRGSYEPAGPIDLGWYGSYVLIGLAALAPSARAWVAHAPVVAGRLSMRRLVTLGTACMLLPVAAAVRVQRGTFDGHAFALGVCLTILLVFWRMALLFREQQRAEAELRESSELYRALVEQSGDMVALLGPGDRLVYASAAHETALGYTPHEMLSLGAEDLVHPEDFERSRRALESVAAGRGPGEGSVIRLRRKDGSWIWVDIRGTAIVGRGGTPLILLTSRDVTRRRQAEEELARTSRNLQTLVDTAPMAIVGADLDGRVTVWNPQAEKLFGWRADEVLGEKTPLLDEAQLAATLSEIHAGRALGGEQTRPHRDGSRVEVVASAVPVCAEDGSVTGVFAVFLDVSERNRLEEQLRQSQRLEAIGQLAGGIAHDFNNLLTAITGYRELALLQAGGNETLQRQLVGIGEAADRAAALTRQLLAFGRRQVLQPTVFDLNDAVAHAESLLRRVLGAHIEVVACLDPAGCPVRADQVQLDQVLMNLAVNARDAMPDGGTLTIETARVDGERVRLRVSDTGWGMDEETVRRAFEPFFTTKGPGKGTGLGLSTVYGIVSQSGGTVEVRSEPGRGATFEVLLPLTHQAPVKVEPQRPEPASGSERVLLVEDEPVVRELTREMLETHGYRVVCAGRPDDALALARSGPFDLLVTDVVMPGMNGRALARALRAERPGLRVLYTSGYSDDAALQGGSLEPLAAFLQKPYSSGELAAAVRRTLDAAA